MLEYLNANDFRKIKCCMYTDSKVSLKLACCEFLWVLDYGSCGVLWSVVECCGVLWSVVEGCGVLWSVVELRTVNAELRYPTQ
jgi:hypothetical protein